VRQSVNYSTVDEYISLFPPEIRSGLELLRSTIRKAAPEAREVISYNMPAYKMKSVLVYFAATKDHYGFYPTSSPITAFKEELKPYDTSKGTIRFPFNKRIPVKLVREIVKFRAMEVLEAEEGKGATRKVQSVKRKFEA
jgi:uncharacterized protein YdhG (YjbR/CyaY superfamily)